MQKCSKVMAAGLIAGSLLWGSFPALAQSTYDPRLDAREQRQQQRIQQGAQAGRFTPKEYNRLERQQAHINRTEARMQADGNLGPRERATLTRMGNHASRNIYRKNHNLR